MHDFVFLLQDVDPLFHETIKRFGFDLSPIAKSHNQYDHCNRLCTP
jgi:hypothetical protein